MSVYQLQQFYTKSLKILISIILLKKTLLQKIIGTFGAIDYGFDVTISGS